MRHCVTKKNYPKKMSDKCLDKFSWLCSAQEKWKESTNLFPPLHQPAAAQATQQPNPTLNTYKHADLSGSLSAEF
jgi:hypothetical protein